MEEIFTKQYMLNNYNFFVSLLLTSQTLPTQCHLTYKKSMALGYELLAL